MSEPNPQLVQAITRQVIEALRQRGVEASRQAAEIHPPAGLCPPGVEAKKTEAGAPATESTTVTLSGIVTANELTAALQTIGDPRKVYLAANARLTPLAQDVARVHAKRIARADGRSLIQSDPNPTPPFLSWKQGHCPVTQAALEARKSLLRALPLAMGHERLAESLAMIAQAIKGQRAVGGILFVDHAPLAICLANRSRSLRAVTASSVESLDQAMATVSPNLLVIEYPRVSAKSLSAMLDRWLAQAGLSSPSKLLERQLEAMSRL